jgi:hypothetical protein
MKLNLWLHVTEIRQNPAIGYDHEAVQCYHPSLLGCSNWKHFQEISPTKFCIRLHYCHQGCCHPAKCREYDGGNLGTDIPFIVITAVIIPSVTSTEVGVVGRIVYFTVTTPVIRAPVILLNAVVMIVMSMVLTAPRCPLMLSSGQMFFTSYAKNCDIAF